MLNRDIYAIVYIAKSIVVDKHCSTQINSKLEQSAMRFFSNISSNVYKIPCAILRELTFRYQIIEHAHNNCVSID